MLAIELYKALKPEVVCTHDCPQHIAREFFRAERSSKTRIALDVMLEFHVPRVWVFGHHHTSISMEHRGCLFRCVAELETFDLEIN